MYCHRLHSRLNCSFGARCANFTKIDQGNLLHLVWSNCPGKSIFLPHPSHFQEGRSETICIHLEWQPYTFMVVPQGYVNSPTLSQYSTRPSSEPHTGSEKCYVDEIILIRPRGRGDGKSPGCPPRYMCKRVESTKIQGWDTTVQVLGGQWSRTCGDIPSKVIDK